MFGSRMGFSGTADRTTSFPVGSNLRQRPTSILKKSNGLNSETHYLIHFMYEHKYTLPSPSIMTVDAYYMTEDWTLITPWERGN